MSDMRNIREKLNANLKIMDASSLVCKRINYIKSLRYRPISMRVAGRLF